MAPSAMRGNLQNILLQSEFFNYSYFLIEKEEGASYLLAKFQHVDPFALDRP